MNSSTAKTAEPEVVHRGTGAMDRHAWAANRDEIGDGERWTLFDLVDHADPSGLCWPLAESLAARRGKSASTITGRLKTLVEAGLVERVRVRKPDGNLGGWLFRVMVPGSCPIDPGHLPRFAGNVVLPDAWLAPIPAAGPPVETPAKPYRQPSTGSSNRQPSTGRTAGSASDQSQVSGSDQSQVSGDQEPSIVLTAYPTQPLEPEDPRSAAAGAADDPPWKDPPGQIPVDPDRTLADYADNPWRGGRRLYEIGVDRAGAHRLISETFHDGDQRAAYAGWVHGDDAAVHREAV